MENRARLNSLRTIRDFESLRKDGQYFHPVHWMTVNYLSKEKGEVRCAWTISRTIAPAVFRNRFRRWGREFFRHWLTDSQGVGVDFNLIFKRRDKGFYRSIRHDEFDRVLKKVVSRFEKLA